MYNISTLNYVKKYTRTGQTTKSVEKEKAV